MPTKTVSKRAKTSSEKRGPKTEIPPKRVSAAVKKLVKELGPVQASARLDVRREAMLKVAEGQPVRPTTIATVRGRLGI